MNAPSPLRGLLRRWVLAALVATGGLASPVAAVAQPLFPTLPDSVAATVERSLERARDRLDLTLAAARTDALRAQSGTALPSWDLSATLRDGPTPGLEADLRASASLLLIDPSRDRHRAELRAQEASLAVQARLARRDAALDTVTSWLAAWAARERRDLSRLAQTAWTASASEERRRLALAAEHPELELEVAIWTERLARLGVPSDAAWPDHRSWRAWALRPLPAACPAEAPEVLVARAEAERLRRSAEASDRAATTPSLRVGGSFFASPAWSGSASANVGAHVWLELAPPALGGWRASLRSALDGEEGSLSLQVGDAATPPPDTSAIELALARDELARTRRDAEERALLARAALRRLLEGLDPTPPARPPRGSSFADVELALADVYDTVRAVDARLRLRIDCALASSARDGPP